MRSIRKLYIRITRNITEVKNKTDDCCINKGNMSISAAFDLNEGSEKFKFEACYLLGTFIVFLGMIFSMCGLMMRLKWCAWVALYCSCISFANSRISDDTKQILSSFMLSISAIVMSYLQNPLPMTPPWATAIN